MLRRSMLVGGLLLAALIGAPASPAAAASFTVNSNLDLPDATPGDNACATAPPQSFCTLRAAVQQANAFASADTITVPAMTITLASQLPISSSLTVQGAGARSTILKGSGSHGMLKVTGGVVSIKDLAITDVTATNYGALAIHQTNGTVTVDRVRVSNIKTTSAVPTWAPLTLDAGTMTIRDSEVTNNTANVTNDSDVRGGALALFAGTATVINSTLADNRISSVGGDVLGGAIFAHPDATVSVISSTVARNTVEAGNAYLLFGGAAFQIPSGTGSIEFTDSLVADSSGTTNCTAGGKTPVFSGRNIIDDTSCGAQSANRTIADPGLGPLGDHGGPTNTRVPAGNGPAIDAASACASQADQRGQARPIGANCDLGAVEVASDRAASVSVSNAAPAPGADLVVTGTARNNGMDDSTGTTFNVAAVGAAQIRSASVLGGSCTIVGTSTVCTIGDLPANSTRDVLLTVQAPTTGTITVEATVGGAQADPVAANNSATATATVGGGGTPAGKCSAAITGTAGPDKLKGTNASERITGLGGKDLLSGKGGKDCLDGGPAKDRIKGGPGNDSVMSRDGVRDQVNCGPGRDRVVADRKDRLTKCEVIRRR